MHKLNSVWYNDAAEGQELHKVQDFLNDILWRPVDQGDGGITWLEMFILYHIRNQEEQRTAKIDKLKAMPKFQHQLAHFKKRVRKLVRHTVPEDSTWHYETSYVARNRLAKAAINNRQAAIRGMPQLARDETEQVMKVLLALRGYDKKKQIEAWKMARLR